MLHVVVDSVNVPRGGLVKEDREGRVPASSFIIVLYPVPELRELPSLC